MSSYGKSSANVNKTIVLETIESGFDGTLTGCTSIVTNLVQSCTGNTSITMGTDLISTNDPIQLGSLSASTIFSGGTNLIDLIDNRDTYLSGSTLSGSTLILTRNDGFNVIQDLSSVNSGDTFVTGATYLASNDTITLSRNDDVDIDITGVTDTFVTGGTLTGSAILVLDRNDSLSAITVDLNPLLDDTNSFVTGSTFSDDTLSLTLNNGDTVETVINEFNNLTVSGYTSIGGTLTASTVNANTYLSGGTNILDIINDNDTFVTGGTLNNSAVLILDRNDSLSAITVDLSPLLDDTNTFVTGTTFTNNTLDINLNNGTTVSTVIDTFDNITVTGDTLIGGNLTVSGDITGTTIDANTYLSGGTNILDIVNANDTFVTGGTLTDKTLVLDRNDSLSAVTIDLSGLTTNADNGLTLTSGGTIELGGTLKNNRTYILNENTNFKIVRWGDAYGDGTFNNIGRIDEITSVGKMHLNATSPTLPAKFQYKSSTFSNVLYAKQAGNVDMDFNPSSTFSGITYSQTDGPGNYLRTIYLTDDDGTGSTTYNQSTTQHQLNVTDGNNYSGSLTVGAGLTQIAPQDASGSGIFSFSPSLMLLANKDFAGVIANNNNVQLQSDFNNYLWLNDLSTNDNILTDGTTNKRGLRYVNFGESDVSGTSANYSTLVGTSLIPKKYFEDNNIYVTGGTYSGNTITLNRFNGSDISITGITTDNFYTTGSTLVGNIAYFDRTDNLSAYTLDLTSLSASLSADTYTDSGFVSYVNEDGTLTLTLNDASTVVITGFTDVQTTGSTLVGSTATFTQNDGSTFDLDLSALDVNDTFITGITFNPSNYQITATRNDGFSTSPVDLSILSADVTITGGTYDIDSGVVTFTNNSGGTFDVSGFTSGMTDSYTTSANLSGNSITFDSNINGSNFYNVDLTPVLSGITLSGGNGITIGTGNTIDLGGLLTESVTILSGDTTNSLDIGGNTAGANLIQARINAQSFQANMQTTYAGGGVGTYVNSNPGSWSVTNNIAGTSTSIHSVGPGALLSTFTDTGNNRTRQIAVGNTEIKINAQNSTTSDANVMDMDETEISIYSVSGGTNELFRLKFDLTGETAQFIDNRANTKGIEYDRDISSGYTDNSLITKRDLDNRTNRYSETGITGTSVVDSISTGTTEAATWHYSVNDGSNLRAGTIVAGWLGSNVVYTETSTTDIGDTSAVTFDVNESGGDIRLVATATSGTWTVKVNRLLI